MCKCKLLHSVESEECDNEILALCHTNHNEGTPAILLEVLINDKVIPMQHDTDAAVSIVSEVECAKHFTNASCRQENVKLPHTMAWQCEL